MKSSFQTPRYNFIVEFNDSICAKKIIEKLPLDSTLTLGQDRICLKAEITCALSESMLSKKVKAGEVFYWPENGYVCIFYGVQPLDFKERLGVAIIGKAELGAGAINSISAGDSVRIASIAEEEKKISFDNVPDPNRKLTQSEIDVLVAQLLAEKKKKP